MGTNAVFSGFSAFSVTATNFMNSITFVMEHLISHFDICSCFPQKTIIHKASRKTTIYILTNKCQKVKVSEISCKVKYRTTELALTLCGNNFSMGVRKIMKLWKRNYEKEGAVSARRHWPSEQLFIYFKSHFPPRITFYLYWNYSVKIWIHWRPHSELLSL